MIDRLLGKEKGIENPKDVAAQFIRDYSRLLDIISQSDPDNSAVQFPLRNILDLLDSVSRRQDIRKISVEYRNTSFRDRHYITDSEDPGIHVALLASNGYRFHINAYGGLRMIGTTSDLQDAKAQFRRGRTQDRRTEEIASQELNLNILANTPLGVNSYQAADAWMRIGPPNTSWIQLDNASYTDRHRFTQRVSHLLRSSPESAGTVMDIRDRVSDFIRIRDTP